MILKPGLLKIKKILPRGEKTGEVIVNYIPFAAIKFGKFRSQFFVEWFVITTIIPADKTQA